LARFEKKRKKTNFKKAKIAACLPACLPLHFAKTYSAGW
jgi:hypothetical protein